MPVIARVDRILNYFMWGGSQPEGSYAIAQKCLGHSLGQYYLWQSPHRHFPFKSQCSGCIGPCGSCCDCKMHLINNDQGTCEKKPKVYYSQVLEGKCQPWGHLGPNSEGANRLRVSENVRESLGFCLYWS